MSWLTAEVEIAPTPRERLLRVFDALDRWFRRDDFHGCMFINAAGEFADGASTARQAAAHHKRRLKAYMADLAAAAGLNREIAAMLFLLAEGAIVAAFVQGDTGAAMTARKAALMLISTPSPEE